MNNAVFAKKLRKALRNEGFDNTKIEAAFQATFETRTQIPKSAVRKAMKTIIARLTDRNEPLVIMRTRDNKIRVYTQTGYSGLQAHGRRVAKNLLSYRTTTTPRAPRPRWTKDETERFILAYPTVRESQISIEDLATKFNRTVLALRNKACTLGITRR
jgi:hypothetical protein